MGFRGFGNGQNALVEPERGAENIRFIGFWIFKISDFGFFGFWKYRVLGFLKRSKCVRLNFSRVVNSGSKIRTCDFFKNFAEF